MGPMARAPTARPRALPRTAFDRLLRTLEAAGYACVGPVVRDGAIVFAPVGSVDELPGGVGADQEPGSYRLHPRADAALFAHAVGPGSARAWLDPSDQLRWRLRRTTAGFVRDDEPVPAPRIALLGVRACDLAAIAVLDRVLGDGPQADPSWLERRAATLLVAVQCTTSAATCFCASTGTGPTVTGGADIVLTEQVGSMPGPPDGPAGDDDRTPPADPEHVFVVEARSPRGEAIVASLGLEPASAIQLAAARAAVDAAAAQQTRHLPTGDLPTLLERQRGAARWAEIAERCLACGNCTLVCPTCFCCDIEDVSDLTGDVAERHRRWSSCFSPDFTEMHGGEVRTTIAGRYRHWLTHKLGTWQQQFGTSGCVGCGRCITWCPVGIDLTAEIAAIAKEDAG
jgi:sulfhydrogenase subunit beta (sulfur reductase)